MNNKTDAPLPDELLEKAEFYILNQKYSEALKILKDVATLENSNPHAHYLYGLALEGSNEREVLELDAGHAQAREHLDRLIG